MKSMMYRGRVLAKRDECDEPTSAAVHPHVAHCLTRVLSPVVPD
jgi:hypothetical protein